MKKRFSIHLTPLLLAAFLAIALFMTRSICAAIPLYPQEQKDENPPQLHRGPSPQRLSAHSQVLLADEVRHQLLMLPYYGVFDWLEGEVLPDGRVTLRGEAVKPATKSEAEAGVKSCKAVQRWVHGQYLHRRSVER